MTNFRQRVHVRPCGNREETISDCSLEQHYAPLFSAEDPSHDRPRSPKRRRLDPVSGNAQASASAQGTHDDIPLVEVQMELVLDDDEASELGNDTITTVEEMPVIIRLRQRPRDRTDNDYFLLTLGRPGWRMENDVTIKVSADDTAELEGHIDHLVAQPSSKTPQSKNTSSPYRMWTEARLTRRSDGVFVLTAKILCSTQADAYFPNKDAQRASKRALLHYCPQPVEKQIPSQSISAQTFYDVVHTPDARVTPPSSIQHPQVKTKLYPFQKRAVSWLLARERVRVEEDGSIVDTPTADQHLPMSYQQEVDASGRSFLASHLLGRVVREPREADSLHRHLYGGILSEEMGLGKTVELIDLLCLHRRTADLGKTVLDAYSNERVKISSATLIVSPPAILEQWISEIQSHAPSLKVFHYKGVKHSKEKIAETLLEQHVVITTYNVLASEIHYADEKPDRSLRHKKKFVARRSPLVKILWWRVCLDEAQMIESGVSSAATVARRIPRCNAWAITGTPLKKDIKDLLGLLIFLRYEPFSETGVWLAMNDYPGVFEQIFRSIALRHTKAQVRQELHLPPQKRVIVTVPFTAIEEQHYKQLVDEMCEDIGLDRDGAPTRGDWDPESEYVVQKMRQWLTRLRQTCLHPEVGERNRRALGRKNGALRTVEEVLNVMIQQNETALRSDERAAMSSKMVQGHLYTFTQDADKEVALSQYLEAFESATQAVIECREQLQDAAKALGKPTDSVQVKDSESEEAEENTSDELNVYRNRLRSALEMQHASAFFVATAYYQVKMEKTDGDEQSEDYKAFEASEAVYYESAKGVRKEMLREITKRTAKLVAEVRLTADSKRKAAPLLSLSSNYGGIESQKAFRASDELGVLMNRQSEQLQEWRAKLAGLLAEGLLDQEDVEQTGEEYEETLKNQDEQYVYLFVLRAAVADRHETITGQINALVMHEVREALRTAEQGQGHAPELMISALEIRQSLAPARNDKKPVSENIQSIRGLVADLRGMVTALRFNDGARGSSRAGTEADILEEELRRLQQIAKDQSEALLKLEKDVDLYRRTMNNRLEYYRQLQMISDTVKPYQEEQSETLDVQKLQREQAVERKQLDKVRGLRTMRNFLQHLKTQKEGTEERRPCTICLQPFEMGVLTVCAHEFCKDCINIWMSEHHTCPLCKKPLRGNDLHNITYKPRKMQAQEERQSSSPSDASDMSSGNSIYSSISDDALNDIKSIDIPTSWGSKIDSIARHLLYLRAQEPGTKTVLFSQYRDFLDVMGKALHRCKIGYSEIQSKNGIQRFKEDPSVECFFLHAKADSSGLNLVNATQVILCEPLINTAVELQAISRVHRIGQRRPTTVWMYLVSDTVEEAIYDISVDRRLRLVGQKSASASKEPSRAGTPALESKLDAANSKELQSAPLSKLMTKGASGGEIVAKDDLWSCLFGKVKSEPSEDTSRQIEEVVSRHLRAEAADERAGPSAGLSAS